MAASLDHLLLTGAWDPAELWIHLMKKIHRPLRICPRHAEVQHAGVRRLVLMGNRFRKPPSD